MAADTAEPARPYPPGLAIVHAPCEGCVAPSTCSAVGACLRDDAPPVSAPDATLIAAAHARGAAVAADLYGAV